MRELVRVPAKVSSTMVGFESHGFLTAMIYLDYLDGMSQGFGGLVLGRKIWGNNDAEPDNVEVGKAFGTYIVGIMQALQVDKWENINGKIIDVLFKRSECDFDNGRYQPSFSSMPMGLVAQSKKSLDEAFITEKWRDEVYKRDEDGKWVER